MKPVGLSLLFSWANKALLPIDSISSFKLLVKPFGPRYLVTKPTFEGRGGQDKTDGKKDNDL